MCIVCLHKQLATNEGRSNGPFEEDFLPHHTPRSLFGDATHGIPRPPRGSHYWRASFWTTWASCLSSHTLTQLQSNPTECQSCVHT